MKKIILTAITFAFTVSFSQNIQGKIKYTESTNNKLMMEGINESLDSSMNEREELNGMAEMIKAQILKEMSKNAEKKKELIFHKNQSVYKESKNVELTKEDIEPSNIIMTMSGNSENEIHYVDYKENIRIIQREFMGKKFLIKDSLVPMKWKLTNERTKILGYNCMKAKMIDSNSIVEVWFTTQIPVSSGPNGLSGLPGIILSCEIGRMVEVPDTDKTKKEVMLSIQATSVELTPISLKEIKKPKKGKVLSSEEEYQKILESVTQDSFGGDDGGSTIIIR